MGDDGLPNLPREPTDLEPAQPPLSLQNWGTACFKIGEEDKTPLAAVSGDKAVETECSTTLDSENQTENSPTGSDSAKQSSNQAEADTVLVGRKRPAPSPITEEADQ